VIVANGFGSVTGSVSVTVAPLSAPFIAEQPRSRTLFPGALFRPHVGATGGELVYQWRKGTTNIAGANTATYVIDGVDPTNSGVFDVVITNSLGSVTSAPAVLTVTSPGAGSFEEAIFNDGVSAWWRLAEESGTNMDDAFGRHDGVYTPGPALGVPGVVASNAAVSFDGTVTASFPSPRVEPVHLHN